MKKILVTGSNGFVGSHICEVLLESGYEVRAMVRRTSNLANLEGLEVARRIFPDLPQVAVFDTAFHQSLPPAAYTYAVPRPWARDHGVRRYGFHGTSHAYVSREAARLLGLDPADARVVVLHLGNGASACAVMVSAPRGGSNCAATASGWSVGEMGGIGASCRMGCGGSRGA